MDGVNVYTMSPGNCMWKNDIGALVWGSLLSMMAYYNNWVSYWREWLGTQGWPYVEVGIKNLSVTDCRWQILALCMQQFVHFLGSEPMEGDLEIRSTKFSL